MSTDNPASGDDMHLFGFMPSTGHANCICGWSSAPVKDRTEARAEYNIHTAAQSPGHSPALGDPTSCRNCLATRWEYDRDPCTRAIFPMRPDPSSPVAVPPTEEQRGQRYHASYEAVYAYIGKLAGGVPVDVVHRNAMIWRAVQAALDAIPAVAEAPVSLAPASIAPTELGAGTPVVPEVADPAIYLAPAQAYCDRILGASKPAEKVADELWLRVVVDAARAPLLAEVASLGTDADRRVWRARNLRRGRCASCGAIVEPWQSLSSRRDPEPHRMRCRWYDGPVTHSWLHRIANVSMGGTDYECTCGKSVRRYWDDPEPTCPNLAETERRPADTTYFATEPEHG